VCWKSLIRGTDRQQGHMVSYLSTEARVRKDHPLRVVRAMVDEVLGDTLAAV
jgi:transposase